MLDFVVGRFGVGRGERRRGIESIYAADAGSDVRTKHRFDGRGGRSGSESRNSFALSLDAAEKVNKAEREYERGKRTLREEKERAKETLDGMYKQLSGAVRKAVPALHKRAVASMYQNRSQEAMIAHAECFDHHQKCKRTVAKLERCWQRREKKKRRERTELLLYLLLLATQTTTTREEEEEEEEERNDALTEEEEEEEEEKEAEEETEEAEETRACGEPVRIQNAASNLSFRLADEEYKEKESEEEKGDKRTFAFRKIPKLVNNVAHSERHASRLIRARNQRQSFWKPWPSCTRLSGDAKNAARV